MYFVHVHHVTAIESDEMEPHWFHIDTIPYEHMWAGDRTWLPLLLQGCKLKGPIVFGPNNSDVASMKLIDVDMVIESELLDSIDLYINE